MARVLLNSIVSFKYDSKAVQNIIIAGKQYLQESKLDPFIFFVTSEVARVSNSLPTLKKFGESKSIPQ
jgi:hypothetical protein